MHELTIKDIQNQIVNLPNHPPAMLASAVAMIYGVEARQVNQAVQRNQERFPDDFCFRLTQGELDNLRSQNVTSSLSHGGQRHLPWMFTRFGANQLSTVLKSPVAARRSVQIMRAFSMLEEGLASSQVYVEPAAPAVPSDCMLVTKDEYIELKQIEVDYYKNLYNSQLPKPRRAARPLLDVDIAEILDLKAQGLSHQEIADKVERSTATISWACRCKEDN